MKGIVFTEFVEMVEDRFGLDTLDSIVAAEGLPSGGVYASTGTYDHSEMVTLLNRLSVRTRLPIPALLKAYGEHLFKRFHTLFPIFFAAPRNAFEFLASINDTIHVEVRKLYPDAELPEFAAEQVDPRTMRMTYRSPRGLVDLAEGLIAGCFSHYKENVTIARDDRSGGKGTYVILTLTSA
jgi:hypothetical protein